MIEWAITALAAMCAALLVWSLAGALKIKSGWQKGSGPLARWLDARRRTKFNEQLPEALATMSNALRAGLAVSQAFDAVAAEKTIPISEEFEILRRQLHVGMGFEEALESMVARTGSEDFALVAGALTVSRRTGGNVTEIFDKIAQTIRERMRVERRVRTLTAQGRMQGLIVTAMPFLLGGALTILKPKLMLPFFCSWMGGACIAGTVLLVIAGWLIIRRIVKIDV